jgi:tetratricopeptide (TPR) repeat protein
MTQEELSNLLYNPEQTGQFVTELAQLVEAHPYFHAGHQLLLKSLTIKEKDLTDQLEKSTLCVCNRTILRNYIREPDIFYQQTGMLQRPEAQESFSPKNAQPDNATEHLIEKFLALNPKVTPSDTAYQVDLTAGLQNNQDLATETLADIYIRQGHTKKAIEIYERLILKYPEKHVYFASRIERLK